MSFHGMKNAARDGNSGNVPPPLMGRQSTEKERQGFPLTFGRPLGPDEPEEKLIFDPSVKQYVKGFRRGDPVLPPEQMEFWLEARREAMMHLLGLVASSTVAGNLVLRGSLALKAFLGEQAREPGDMDWVVQPADWRMDTPESLGLLRRITQAVIHSARGQLMEFDVDAISSTEIWTYDRAPGQRIAFPWRSGDLPPAVIQMDFVFEQKLHTPPVEQPITLGSRPSIQIRCASGEESLAWKLQWLWNDMWPQGKDLYDAVLLAERFPLSADLLMKVLGESDVRFIKARKFPFNESHRGEESTDWDNFKKECPWITGTEDAWKERLIEAIKPTREGIRTAGG